MVDIFNKEKIKALELEIECKDIYISTLEKQNKHLTEKESLNNMYPSRAALSARTGGSLGGLSL